MRGDFVDLELGDFVLIPELGLKFSQALPNFSSSTCRLCLLSPAFDREDHDWICWGEPYSEKAVFNLPTQLT